MTAALRTMTRTLSALVLLAALLTAASQAAVPEGASPLVRMAANDEAADSLDSNQPVVDSLEAAATARDAAGHTKLESLVPELAAHPYRITPGVPDFHDRLSLSPGYGFLGSGHLFALRVTYEPGSWFGYEASIAHNPGHAVHAMLHTLSAIVRVPLAGRFQPYVSGGYGMTTVFPGQTVNAAPVTKNTLTFGAGLELYIRNDLALRADLRQATIIGEQRDRTGIVAYDYAEGTIGFAFYRTIRP